MGTWTLQSQTTLTCASKNLCCFLLLTKGALYLVGFLFMKYNRALPKNLNLLLVFYLRRCFLSMIILSHSNFNAEIAYCLYLISLLLL